MLPLQKGREPAQVGVCRPIPYHYHAEACRNRVDRVAGPMPTAQLPCRRNRHFYTLIRVQIPSRTILRWRVVS